MEKAVLKVEAVFFIGIDNLYPYGYNMVYTHGGIERRLVL